MYNTTLSMRGAITQTSLKNPPKTVTTQKMAISRCESGELSNKRA